MTEMLLSVERLGIFETYEVRITRNTALLLSVMQHACLSATFHRTKMHKFCLQI